MRRRETQSLSLYFIQDDINAIEQDILTISKDTFDHLLNKISAYARNDLLEIDILDTFLAIIQEKKEYYCQKQKQSYDYGAFKSAIIFIIILGLLMIGFYVWQSNDFLKHHQMTNLIEELKSYGITVKEHSKRYYKHTQYWLEVIPIKDLAHYQWIKAKNILDQLYELHSTIYGTNRWIFIIMFCVIMFSIKKLFLSIRQWLKPRYKERYEKYVILENEIEQKIINLSSKHKIKLQ